MKNPDTPELTKRRPSGIKNWIVLGGIIAGGYFAYKYFQEHESELKNDMARSPNDPDLNGPPVQKFGIYGTRSKICVAIPDKRFSYAPISSINAITGNAVFSATTTGNFTRRLLCRGAQRWAEIKPAR